MTRGHRDAVEDSRDATNEMLDAIGARWGREAQAKAALYVSAYLNMARTAAVAGLGDFDRKSKDTLVRYMEELSAGLTAMAAAMLHEHGGEELFKAATAASRRPVDDMIREIHSAKGG